MLDNRNGWESLESGCFGEAILIMRWCDVTCDNRAKRAIFAGWRCNRSTNYQVVEKATVVSEIDSNKSRNKKLKVKFTTNRQTKSFLK